MMLKPNNWPALGILTMVAAATAALSIFIKVTEEVVEGDTGKIDLLIIMWLRTAGNPTDPLGPRWFEDYARDITALGSPPVLGLFVLICVIFLLLSDKRRLSIYMLITAGCGTLVVTALKEIYDRPRPQLMPDHVFVYAASFPSAHAMVSAVVYLTLGTLIARLTPNTLLKLYIMSVAVILTGMIGLSRIYLGVHWPSDVLAGWAVGAAWVLGGEALAQIMKLDEENTK